MDDPLGPICSEFRQLQIHKFAPFFRVTIGTVQIREFATGVTQNVSKLENKLWRSKLLRIPFLVRLGSLLSQMFFFFIYFNNRKFQINHCNF